MCCTLECVIVRVQILTESQQHAAIYTTEHPCPQPVRMKWEAFHSPELSSESFPVDAIDSEVQGKKRKVEKKKMRLE